MKNDEKDKTKKETVQISLPPKPHSAVTIALPPCPPKPGSVLRGESKKETVRIILPPKSHSTATIKLPSLPQGGSPWAESGTDQNRLPTSATVHTSSSESSLKITIEITLPPGYPSLPVGEYPVKILREAYVLMRRVDRQRRWRNFWSLVFGVKTE